MPLARKSKDNSFIKFVDDVFVSIDEYKTVCNSLPVLKPNIFAKSGDMFSGKIPEWPICKKLGINIVDGLGQKI